MLWERWVNTFFLAHTAHKTFLEVFVSSGTSHWTPVLAHLPGRLVHFYTLTRDVPDDSLELLCIRNSEKVIHPLSAYLDCPKTISE